jgi:hypothetical protein
MDTPNQRIGSVSNTHVGSDFERIAMKFVVVAVSRQHRAKARRQVRVPACAESDRMVQPVRFTSLESAIDAILHAAQDLSGESFSG